ncbi:MAG: hypothetical protein JNM10_14835 [Planctomycetia bacterium]|nr:hypothetical protein [Planctomycetia bacterium]
MGTPHDVGPLVEPAAGPGRRTALDVLGVVVVVLGIDASLRPQWSAAMGDPALLDLARRIGRLGDPRLHGARWWTPSVGFAVASVATAVGIVSEVGRARAVGVALFGLVAGLVLPRLWTTALTASMSPGWMALTVASLFGVALIQVVTPGPVGRVFLERFVGVAGVNVLAVLLDHFGVGPFAFGVAPAATAAFVVAAVRAPAPAPIRCGRGWVAAAGVVAAVAAVAWFAAKPDDEDTLRGPLVLQRWPGVVAFAGCVGLALAIRRPGRAHLVPAWCVLVGLTWGTVFVAPWLAVWIGTETPGTGWVLWACFGLAALLGAPVLVAGVVLVEPEVRFAEAFGPIAGAVLGATLLSFVAAPFLSLGAAAIWQVVAGIAIASVLRPQPPRGVPPTDAAPLGGAPLRPPLPSPWGDARDRAR